MLTYQLERLDFFVSTRSDYRPLGSIRSWLTSITGVARPQLIYHSQTAIPTMKLTEGQDFAEGANREKGV
jgi:hypothetical protein